MSAINRSTVAGEVRRRRRTEWHHGRVPALTPRRVRALTAAALSASLLGGVVACTADGGSPAGPADPGSSRAADRAKPSPSEKLGLETGWGPTREELDTAAERVGRMSTGELAGQVIVARWSGTQAPVRLVRDNHLGGVIVFDDNVTSPGQLRSLTARLQQRSGRRWPVLVGVDQEGGLVERIRGAATRFPAFMAAGAADRPRLTRSAYAAGGAELRWMGLNVDFAPDADVTVGPADPAIGSRAAGDDPESVAAQSLAAAQGFLDAGVVPVVKHFPGHGSVTTDSHVGLPVQDRSLRELRRNDLVPFRTAIRAGLPAVMVGHIAVGAVDPGTPATVSKPVINGMLRGDLGFEGLVVSDALDMAAVSNQSKPAVRFLQAGGDVVLMPPDPVRTRQTIVAAVRRGDLGKRDLERSAARMVALLEHRDATSPRRGGSPGSARDAAARLTEAALTVASGPCRGRLVDGPVVAMGDPEAVETFRAAASAAGMSLGSVTYTVPPRPRRTGRTKQDQRDLAQWKAIEPTPVVNGTPVRLGTTDGPGPPGVLVATGTPYVLGYLDAPVEIATYAATPAAMDGLVALLLGRRSAPGRLPVDVTGVQRRGC